MMNYEGIKEIIEVFDAIKKAKGKLNF